MRAKIAISLRPSRRAASRTSCGKDREAWRKSRMRKGVDTVGRMTAHRELTSPTFPNSWNRGIIVAAKGIIIASSRIAMTTSLPLEW